MKRIVIIVLSLIVSTFCVAQECIIKIYQRCESYCHCKQRDFPYVKNWYIESSNSSGVRYGNLYENLEENRKSDIDMDYSFYDYFSFNDIPSKLTITDYIYDYGEDEGKGSKTIKTEFDNIDVGEYSNTSENYETNCQKILWNPSHEGFKIITNVIVDCVVNLSSTNKNLSNLIIENNEKLSLDFGKYYSVLGVDPVLEVNINGLTKNDLKGREYYVDVNNSIWIKLPNKVYPSGGVSLSFEDIVGNYGNDLYKKASGKTMTFRVRKKMINGLDKTGKVVEAKFYHQGPDFSYNKIRQVKCLGGPGLSISVHLADPKNIDMYLNNPSIFHWVLTHYAKAVKYEDNGNGMIDKDGNRCVNSAIFYLTKAVLSSSNDVILVGEKKDDSNFSLEKYLNEESAENPSDGLWILQLQYNDDSLKELSFISHWFQLEVPVSAIKPTHETGNYVTSDGKSIYSIVSTHTPEIKVNIPTADYENRMDYKIYQFGEGTSSVLGTDDSKKVSNFNKAKTSTSPIVTISESLYQSDGTYTISNLKVDKTAQTRYFYIQDNDGCIYEVPYKAVQKDFRTIQSNSFTRISGNSPTNVVYSTSIKYEGGAFPYSYNGNYYTPNEIISISGLKYDIIDGQVSSKKTITFIGKDGKGQSVDINLPAFVKPTFKTTAQTCPKANGKIVVDKKGSFEPVRYKIGSIESINGIFENIAAGTYDVECIYSDGFSTKVRVSVSGDKIFSIDKVNDIRLDDFDKQGAVTITPKNYDELSWDNTGKYNITSGGSKSLGSGNYYYKVTNHSIISNDNCTLEDGFNIIAPHVNVTFKVETFAGEKPYIKTSIPKNEVTNSDEIKNSLKYYIDYNNKSSEMPVQFDYLNAYLSFRATYKLNGNVKPYSFTTNNSISPIYISDDLTEYFSESPQPKCYNTTVEWVVQEGYEVSRRGSSDWQKRITLNQGENNVTIRKRSNVRLGSSNDFVATVENIGYRDFTVHINIIPPITISKTIHDVSCVGDSNGSVEISVSPKKNGDESYIYDIKMGDHSSSSKTLSYLPSGSGTITVTDKQCQNKGNDTFTISQPEIELKVEQTAEQPDCHSDGGVILVIPSGGWNSNYEIYIEEGEKYEAVKENEQISFKKLLPNVYKLIITDSNNCMSEHNVRINEYVNPYVDKEMQTDSVSCYGLSDGVIKGIEVKTNGSLNGNAVSVTEMKYWKVGKEDAVEGEKDAELEKSDEKGWIPYSESIHDLKAGTYKILLKDNNECESGEYSIEVKEPDGIQLAVEPKYKYYGEDGTEKGKIKSYGGDDGEIKVRVDGGNYGYKYVIVEANTTQVPTSTYNSIGNLSAQKYTVIATDNKNCPSNSVDVELVAPLTPLKVEINTTDALCRSRVGSATVAVEGGWSDYKIDLVGEHETRSTVGKTVTYEGLYAGKYELHVTDDMGVTLDTVLVISSPEPISYTYDITPEVCEENTGVIKIEFEDEDPQCKLFFGGQEYDVEEREIRFENLSSNKAGGYVMTIVDKNECESELTFEVPDNKMTVSIEDRYEVNKGVMSAVVDHGAAPYMYKWEYMSGSNEMGTESSFATDKNGIYHLTVTDVNGCTREKTHSLLLEGDRRFIVEEVHRETAFEKKDGLVKLRCEEDEITVERLYIYIGEEKKELKDVKKDGSSYIIDDLAGGDYSVEGILANGCKVLADFHIKSYEKMDADVVILRHVSRPKYSDGVINVDVTGGIAPYTVRISTEVGDNVGDEMETTGRLQIDNLQAGIYTLSITDSTENVLTLENYEIKEPAPIKVTSTDKRANCYNEKSAEAKIMAEGGWPGYQYADAKEGVYKNSNIFTELPAGRRKFYVIDKYGVVDSIFVRLTEPDELRATVAAIDSVKCKGDSNGKILFDVTGGTPGYKTLMLKDGIAYDMRDQVGWDNLLSGHYTATFTDYNRCETPDTIEFYIPEPDSLEVALMDVVHTTCELDNGKISIRMKGGSLPYKYEWAENGEVYTKNKNIGLTLTQAEGLLQNGLYRVEIRDSHDCYAKTEDVRIAESHNPEIKQDGVQTIDALCKNSSDGTAYVDSADIIVGVPSSPFKLIWPQGQSDVMKVRTLPAGRYEVEIRDENNCFTKSMFSIGEPDSVSNRLVGLRNALCYGYSDGRIETATIGGVGGYSYLWNTGETTNYLDSIKAGEYTVVVKDAHGCEHVASYEITEPEELKVYLGEDVLICPKGVHVFDGGEYTTYSWRKVATGEEIETGRYMATGEEGDYAIKVTNAIGCIARDTVNLSIGENALIANFLMASDAAVNDTIELIELSNMPIDSLRWVYNTDIFSDVTPYGAGRDRLDILAGETGSYYITMWAYSGGCESFEDKHIDICEALDKDADFEIGYDPIIQSVKATPNPNDGEFNLIVKLREEYDVTVTINSVNTGQQIEKLELKGADKYNHRLNIRDWGSGMYVLSVFVGDERRAVKVVSTR